MFKELTRINIVFFFYLDLSSEQGHNKKLPHNLI